MQRIKSPCDNIRRIRGIWDEKTSQLSTRLEYAQLGLADHTAEILNSQFENFTGLGIANATGEKEPYNREDINAGVNTTITPVKFTKAIEITEEIENVLAFPQYCDMIEVYDNHLTYCR